MSRIDEALKRATAAGGASAEAKSAAQQAPFVSAWADAADPQPATVKAPPPLLAAPAPFSSDTSDGVLVSTPSMGVSALIASWGERLTCAPTCGSAVVEQFRRLAAVLHKAQIADQTRVVMVTSAAPSDGKTLTAINLALALSDSYKRRVLLVDADLRCPSIGKAAGLNGAAGLSEGLKAKSEQKLKIVPLTATLTLLPGGAPDPDPMSSLTSPRMRLILDEALRRFDWVIIDAPPIGPVADANLLAEMVDTSVLVVRAAQTKLPSVQKAIETLGRERLLGVVLNGVSDAAVGEYGKY